MTVLEIILSIYRGLLQKSTSNDILRLPKERTASIPSIPPLKPEGL
jgi:hypothetical protein